MAFFSDFNRAARFAPRLAAQLSAFSASERLDKREYLARSSLNAQLKLILRDNKHIYDVKVVFRRNSRNSLLGFHATKDFANNVSVDADYKVCSILS